MDKAVGTVIVHLDHTVGELRTVDDRVIGADLWPATHLYIENLRKRSYIVSLAIPQKLETDELVEVEKFLPSTRIYSGDSLESLLGECAVSDAEGTAIFASIDRQNRAIACQSLKLEVVPHLCAATWILDGEQLSFARIITSQKPNIKMVGLLPYYLERQDDEWFVLGLVTDSARLELMRAGATIDMLSFDYRIGDCAFLRVDSKQELNTVHWEGGEVIAAEGNRLLIASYGLGLNSTIAPPSGHGALEVLMPSPELLTSAEPLESFANRAVAFASALKSSRDDLIELEAPPSPPAELALPLPDAQSLQDDSDRYSGHAPLDSSGVIISRHIQHPDNARAVNALVNEFSGLGYCTYTHSFAHGGQILHNVIADMPGRGYFRIKPEILKRLLKILRAYPYPWPWPKIEKKLERELGPKVMKELRRTAAGPLRLRMEEIISAYRWLPWWKFKKYILGFGAQIVIVGCHLDSSGNLTSGGYNPVVDPAPGMDDDASGIACCLAVARYLNQFRNPFVHTVRFCLFNAEETGLVGSKAYAAYLKSVSAPVKAVICADMIGYNSDANSIFEVHAGYTDPSIRDRNLPLATTIATWASSLGALEPAQIYQGTSIYQGAPDRNLYDPAINRSDHGSFHQQGYPAIAVTEDFFTNLSTEPGKDPNPNYHTANDVIIDANYGAAIAGAISSTIKELANT